MEKNLNFDFVELQVFTIKPLKLLSLHVFENKNDTSIFLSIARLLLDAPLFREKSSVTNYKGGKRLRFELEGSNVLLELNFCKDDIKL